MNKATVLLLCLVGYLSTYSICLNAQPIPESLYRANPNTKEGIDYLFKYINGNFGDEYRRVAIKIIAERGDKRIIPHLERFIDDKDINIQRTAAYGLYRLKANKKIVYEKIEQLINNGDRAALMILYQYHDSRKDSTLDTTPEAIRLIGIAKKSTREEVRSMAIALLSEPGRLFTPDEKTIIINILANTTNRRERREILQALTRANTNEANELLLNEKNRMLSIEGSIINMELKRKSKENADNKRFINRTLILLEQLMRKVGKWGQDLIFNIS